MSGKVQTWGRVGQIYLREALQNTNTLRVAFRNGGPLPTPTVPGQVDGGGSIEVCKGAPRFRSRLAVVLN